MILPNGCSCSEPTIFPKKRSTKVVNKKWYVQYYFTDPAYRDQYKYGKLCIVKRGVNHLTSFEEKEFTIQGILQLEIQKLKAGYNPLTGKKAIEQGAEINSYTPLPDALQLAYERMPGVKGTKDGVKIILPTVKKAISRMRFDFMPVTDVEPKHIKILLDSMEVREGFSPAKYNRYRANLMMLFKVLKKNFVIKQNPVTEVEKKQTVKKIRATLSESERREVNKLLREQNPHFYRFMHIFFHSGCRETELLTLQGKDVDLQHQKFRCIVRKRSSGPVEVEKTIKDIALPFWKEAMQDCGNADYVFAKGLQPGPLPINAKQISRRWRLWIKKKTGITCDFYALKHLHTTEVVELLGEKEAAKHNAHTNTAMVVNIYDVKNKERKHAAIKGIDNAL